MLKEGTIQLNLSKAIADFLSPGPIFLLGMAVICILLTIMLKKNQHIPKVKLYVVSIIMYYYLCLLFTNIVDIPTISFLLNIVLFVPLGFLCPMLSRTYEHARNVILLGFGLALFVEVTQLFTLYRATDIDDVIANILGTLVGYLSFRLLAKLNIVDADPHRQSERKDGLTCMPIVIAVTAFVLEFFD